MLLMSAQPQLFETENDAYLQKQIVTYLGNKRALLPLLQEALSIVLAKSEKPRIEALDLFSGSGVVARFMKRYSSRLHTNDLERYSSVLNHCYLTNHSAVDWAELNDCLHELKRNIAANWRSGFISSLYAPRCDDNIQPGERAFYTRRNAEYLDTARQELSYFPDHIQTLLLGPLLARASVHANTSGVFKGFYKSKDGVGQFGGTGKDALFRIKGQIEVELPILSNFQSEVQVFREDATTFFDNRNASYDLVYIDPPYNQHPYGSNYFMLNLLCEYEEPSEISHVSGIPVNWNRSDFNKRPKAEGALFKTVEACNSRFVLISYNSEGFVPHQELLDFIRRLGTVTLLQTPYNTFRGSRNLRERAIHVTEFLYLLEKK